MARDVLVDNHDGCWLAVIVLGKFPAGFEANADRAEIVGSYHMAIDGAAIRDLRVADLDGKAAFCVSEVQWECAGQRCRLHTGQFARTLQQVVKNDGCLEFST